MKRCKKSGVVQELGEFYANPGARDGPRPECKQCTAATRKVWYRHNRGKVIARVQRWREDNRDRYLTYQREYKRSRPEQERGSYLRRTFGITLAAYEGLLERQSAVVRFAAVHRSRGLRSMSTMTIGVAGSAACSVCGATTL